MKQKTLFGEVQRTQFFNLFVFGFLVLLMAGFVTWNQTIQSIKERLLVLDKALERELRENSPAVTEHYWVGNRNELRQSLEPRFRTIIRCYPREYTAGFYTRDPEGVAAVISNDSTVNVANLYHYILPPDDPGRKSWETRRPRYTFLWSPPRQAWLLKCDYPVIQNGAVIGHTFANITLSKMILLYFNMGLAILLIVVIAGNISFLTMRRTTRKIRKNAEQLLSPHTNPQFDYVEFQKVAAELQFSQKYRETMLANFPWGYAVINSLGNIVEFNDNGLAMLGLKPEDIIGTRLKDWDGNAPLLRAVESKKPVFGETAFVLPTGERRMYYTHSFPMTLSSGEDGAMAWFLDITERVYYEKALAKERELLMIILNSLTEGVIATDAGNRIILINETAANLTGYPPGEATGQPLEKILYMIDDKTSEPVNPVVLWDIARAPRRPVLITRDLKEISVAFHCSPIKSSDAQVLGFVTVFQDITEQQKTEQELFKAEKLESLGILAGGIAHDFNNLLAAILSNIQLAQIKYRQNKDIDRYLQESMEATYRASDLTRQLLTFSKGGAPVKKAASLAELIRDTAGFVLRGSKVKVECRISETLWPVEVDTGQISQVIHNLVINAKQAMPKGGILEIAADNITIPPGHRFHPGNYIKIAVKDQGVGIARETLPKIFDPFFTTKKDGSGLGLATSYSIIRRHDGYLEVDSEVGAGTTFIIYLPALSQSQVSSGAETEAAAAAEGLKILLMDDEAPILKSVGETLRYYGHQVLMVTDGLKAIEIYRKALEDGAPFDVVIMDLTVPGGMGGQEAIAHLRDIDPKVKAIVSSGYANDPIIADFERFGFCGVVAKPYKYSELNEVLRRVVEGKQPCPDLLTQQK